MNLGELFHLASARVEGAEDAIRRAYEWRHERALSASKGLLGLAATLLVGLALSALKEEVEASAELVKLAVGGILLTAIAGAVPFLRARLIQQEYVASLITYSLLRRLFP